MTNPTDAPKTIDQLKAEIAKIEGAARYEEARLTSLARSARTRDEVAEYNADLYHVRRRRDAAVAALQDQIATLSIAR